MKPLATEASATRGARNPRWNERLSTKPRALDAMPRPLPSGQTVTVRVLEVLYQPESRGDFHL
ncbi:MAG: hypothetical protein R3A52_02615 [Polyangiales bacterium]